MKNKIILGILFTFIFTVFANTCIYASSVNKSALSRAINNQYTDGSRSTMLLSKDGYVEENWNDYLMSLISAKKVETDERAVQEEVDAAALKLESDRAALVADLSQYNNILNAVKQNDYTVKSWDVYKDVVNANKVTGKDAPAKVAEAVKNIKEAQAKLVLKADLTAYNAALAAVQEKDKKNYTDDIWNAYINVVKANKVTVENTQKEVDTATANILEAQKHLVTDLTKYNEVLNAVDKENCTARSWNEYQKVVAANVMTLSNKQYEVDDATKHISKAQRDLRVDFTNYINIIRSVTNDGYTAASWNSYIKTVIANMINWRENAVELTAKTRNIIQAQKLLEADLTQYNNVLNSVKEADYTSASWLAYQKVVNENAMTVHNTPTEVKKAVDAIKNAQKALVFAGKADLDAAKLLANAKIQSDYTLASWAVLTNALSMPETTNAEVVAKSTAINNAISKLITVKDFNNLAIAKYAASLLLSADYTDNSWKVLQDALLLPETTNAEIVAKTSAINNAISLLKFAGQADLDAAKLEASKKVEINYTASSWKALKDALALSETTNAQVVAKTIAINNALANLVIFTDTTELTYRINAQYVDKSSRTTLNLLVKDYTELSWKTYMDALENAKKVEFDSNSLQTEVNDALASLNNAILNLVFAGKANLDAAKANTTNKNQADYTPSSWAALVSAKALPETTNDQVVAKTNAINNAVNSLVFVGKANLDAAKANAASKNQANYTVASWSVLVNALSMPETTNALIVSKTVAINNAINALVPIAVKYRVVPYVGVNCRMAPSINSQKVSAYTYGSIIEITEINNGWGRTSKGWVCLTYLTKLVTTVRYIVTPYVGLNCRIAPDLNSQKVTAYAYRTILEIGEVLNGWGNTQRGWVFMQYLNKL